MRTLRIFAILIGLASALFCGIWLAQYRSMPPVLPLLGGALLLAIASIWRPVSRRRRRILSLAWFAYAGATVASTVLMILMAAPQSALAGLLTLLCAGTMASLRAAYLLTRNPRASLQNYYDG